MVAKLRLDGVLLVLLVSMVCSAYSQKPTPTPTPTPAAKAPPMLHKPGTNIFKDIASDQKAIWTSPFHIQRSDWKWLAPFLGGTAALIATDKKTSAWVSRGGSLPAISRGISLGGSIYSVAGVSGGMYLIGRWTHHDRLQETGRLAVEALADSQIVTQASKLIFGRERPNQGDGGGRFFHGGRSFFSGHASASWSVASVVACEYSDHKLAVWGSYGLATAVSLSRYTGRKHFLSDVFVGSAVGYGIGRYVCGKRKTARSDDDTVTMKDPRWRVMPYLNASTGAKGGTFVWTF